LILLFFGSVKVAIGESCCVEGYLVRDAERASGGGVDGVDRVLNENSASLRERENTNGFRGFEAMAMAAR
jgi:hypothetical protein